MSEAVKIIQHIIVAISSRSQGNNCISEATPSVCGCRDFDWIGWEVPRGWGNGWKRKKSQSLHSFIHTSFERVSRLQAMFSRQSSPCVGSVLASPVSCWLVRREL